MILKIKLIKLKEEKIFKLQKEKTIKIDECNDLSKFLEHLRQT